MTFLILLRLKDNLLRLALRGQSREQLKRNPTKLRLILDSEINFCRHQVIVLEQ